MRGCGCRCLRSKELHCAELWRRPMLRGCGYRRWGAGWLESRYRRLGRWFRRGLRLWCGLLARGFRCQGGEVSASITVMNWKTVCAELSTVECADPSIEVNGVAYDSRRVGRGDVFVAMRGEATDGNRYIEAAVAKGAAAVVTDSREAYAKLLREHTAVAAALVERGRRALAEIGVVVMGHPER